MNLPTKNPFELLIDEIRAVVREEVQRALTQKQLAKMQFSTDEAAEILSVKKSWLAGRVRAEELPHRRAGHRVYFTQQDIDEIMLRSAVRPKNGNSNGNS